MSDSDDTRRLGLMGLPATGKTTYLGAFYAAVDQGDGDARITRYGKGDREYLNARADELAEGKSVARTGQQDPGELRLHLSFDGGEEQLLVVPDLSGEIVEVAMGSRLMDERLEEVVGASSALLIFLRADRVVPVRNVTDLQMLFQLAGITDQVASGRRPEPDDWELDVAPTQARLTDIVQELLHMRADLPRLGVIISAWDKAGNTGAPADWLSCNMPLLQQRLNWERELDWTVFGVSAQGGDFSDPEEKERLIDMPLTARGKVVDASGAPVSISAPLRWALGI